MIEMTKNIKKELELTNSLLLETADFLTGMADNKEREIQNYQADLEVHYSEEINSKLEQAILEYNTICLKIEWEKREITKFEKKIKQFEVNEENKIINNLSKKIIKSARQKTRKPDTET